MQRFLILTLFVLTFLFAQSQVNDFEIWTGTKFGYDLTTNVDLSFEEEFRFFDNATRLLQHHSEIQIAYSFNNWLKTSVSYRLSQENNRFEQFENQHRVTLNARLRKKVKRFRFSYRLRYQHTYSEYNSSIEGKVPNRIVRNRLSAKYDIKNFKGFPFIEYENFFSLSSESSINKYETTLGFSYPFSKKMNGKIEYSFRKQVWYDIPINRYILVIAVNYDL